MRIMRLFRDDMIMNLALTGTNQSIHLRVFCFPWRLLKTVYPHDTRKIDLCHYETNDQSLQDVQVQRFYAENLPLPDERLIELQYLLARVLRMSGARSMVINKTIRIDKVRYLGNRLFIFFIRITSSFLSAINASLF
jgi:hypothetical protein